MQLADPGRFPHLFAAMAQHAATPPASPALGWSPHAATPAVSAYAVSFDYVIEFQG
jgi:hypothetical protein